MRALTSFKIGIVSSFLIAVVSPVDMTRGRSLSHAHGG